MVARNTGGDFAANVSVHIYDTPYTASHSGQALNEIVVIETSSDVVHEVQVRQRA